MCVPSKEEANGCSAVLSAYTITHDIILVNESVMAKSPQEIRQPHSAKSDPATLSR